MQHLHAALRIVWQSSLLGGQPGRGAAFCGLVIGTMGFAACAEDATGSASDVASDVASDGDPRDTASEAPETDVASEVTPTEAGCQEGAACSDFDSCTVDDVCVHGVCVGTPLGCDDQIPCTLDSCSGGTCLHEVADGFCRLDGHCYADSQKNPENACEECDASASRGAWTSLDGRKCNDGDPCTDGETCLAGACQGGVALTTGDCHVDPPDPIAPPCTTHFDCYPDKVCARWRGDLALHCSAPCGDNGACGADAECVKAPGSANVGFCEMIATGGAGGTGLKADAAACTLDAECRSGICFANVCRATCFGEAGCGGSGMTCRPVGDVASGLAMAACVPDDPTLETIGEVCAPGGQGGPGADFNVHYCTSGHCDLIPYGTVGPDAPLTCAPLCQADRDCGLGQECGVVLYGESAAPGAVPFHPQFTTPTRSAVTACFTRPEVAASHLPGTPCTDPSECASSKCLHLIPGDDTRYCSAYCATSDDCPSGMHCKPDTITLASDWLQTPWIDAQAPTTAAWTIARVCKFE